MIELLVALLLHNNEPVKLLAVSVELPQLFATVTVGAFGTTFGAEVPEPAELVQEPIFCVTV